MTVLDAPVTKEITSASSYDPHAETIEEIRALHRERCFYIKSDTACINQLKAYARMYLGWAEEQDEKKKTAIKTKAGKVVDAVRKDKDTSEYDERLVEIIETTLGVRGPMDAARSTIEKHTVKLVVSMPIWTDWAKDIRGLGEKSIGTIIGECGSLGNYANPAKVWKRMGLAPYKGKACSVWRKMKPPQLDKDDWAEAGYSPTRRSWAFNMGDPIIKTTDSPYRELYLERKALEYEKCKNEGFIPVSEMQNTVDAWAQHGMDIAKVTTVDKETQRSAGHMEKRARRYMEKRVLRDMWRAWRDVMPI